MRKIIAFTTIFSFLVLLWLTLSSQKQFESKTVLGQDLDSLIQAKPKEEAIQLLGNYRITDIQKKDWIAFDEHTRKLSKFYEQDHEWTRVDSLLYQSIRTLESHNGPDTIIAKLSLINGYSKRMQEKWSDALRLYKKSIQIYESVDYHGPFYSKCQSYAAQVLMRFGDYAEANKLFNSALQHNQTQRLYTQAANCYFWQDSLVLAQLAIEKASLCPSEGKQYDATFAATIAAIQIKLNQLDLAEQNAHKALALYIGESSNEQQVIRLHTTLAEIATAQKQYTKAVKHIQDAEKLALGYFKGKSRELAKLYVEYGDACRNLGQTERAMGFYQKAVINAWPEFHKTDIQANPDTISIPAEEWAIQSLIRKAELLLASKNPSLAHRLNAATCFDLAWHVHAKLQALYAGDQSKLALLKRRDDQRKLAAQNLLVISSLQSNPIDQQAAIRRLFDWMESGRALVLRDALTTQKTLENLQLPAQTLQEITDLRRDYGVIESQLQEAIALADTAKTEQMRAASYKCSQRLSALQMQLEQDYPAYVKYRTATNTTLANQIQPKLNESEAICSWLSVSDSMLCVVLTHTEAVAFTIPFGVKEQEIIQQYQKLLVDRVAQESDPVAFLDVAHAAYQVLFAKAPAALLNKPNWAMVPDGPLVSLPFDALVKTKGTTNYGSANWLLKEHNIKYLWCAGLALNHSRTDCQPAAVLHFLPFQSHENQEYAALTNSEQEVHTQKRIKSLENQSGTLAAFTDLAHAYSLVHLSTHADPNKIQFSDRGLSLTELYGLTLNNNLVVLSACETNVGKFAEAEGALSLARAFAYAGAQSLISSFWKVNDQSTAGLFAHFYAELEAGKTKSEALHQAKLAFLSNTKHQANQAPWYWAAFSFYGTDGCIKIENAPIPLAWWLAGVLVVCALVFFVVKKKKLA